MADFENSRILTTVMRRDLLSGSVMAASMIFLRTTEARGSTAIEEDPTIARWQKWFEARQALDKAVVHQQSLETQLFSLLGSPARVSKEKWEQAKEECGYRAAKDAEFLASEIDERLAEELWRLQARSVVGVTAKLHAVLTVGEPSVETDEFPWPQIRSIVDDLIAIVDAQNSVRRSRGVPGSIVSSTGDICGHR